ncbi:DUF5317 family protein [Thermus tengchongensis]|uniref:DUF5317 family protein n=1 Tax=Thermus tengchongensis TaxID=1214928 RepID=UPI00068AADA5|nr:DUF5317 family protein [Thermus tengchongensis]
MTGAALFSLGLGALLRYLGVRWGTPLTLRHFWLPLSVLAVEVLGVLMGFPLQGLVYPGVFLWLALNWHPIFLPSLLGAGLNALAILLYGGMPVDPVALERAGLAHTVPHLASREDGLHYLRLAFPLGDWIALPGRVLSPGDLLICLSLFLVALRGAKVVKE